MMQYQEMKFKISPKFTGDVFHLSDPELFENPKINKNGQLNSHRFRILSLTTKYVAICST